MLVNAVTYVAVLAVTGVSLAKPRTAAPVTVILVFGDTLLITFNLLMMLYFEYGWATEKKSAPAFVVATVLCGLSALSRSSQSKRSN